MAATPTSRRAPPDARLLSERRDLCADRVEIERCIKPHETRAAAIDARLKVIATDIDEAFKETFDDGSFVSVAGAVAAEFKGDVPVIQSEAWRALSSKEQRDLVKRGLVKIEPQWGRASNGRVAVKIFAIAG